MSKSVPFSVTVEVRDSCLCLHVQRSARTLARRFDEALRPAGLTNGQFSLLMSLNRPVPPAMGPVATLLAMDRTTLTAALKPLQRHGLVEVEPDPDDRRARRLVLTDRGRETLAAAVPIWRETNASLEGGLKAVDAGRLRRALQDLSQAASCESFTAAKDEAARPPSHDCR